jgi:hypothetical protein
MTLTFAAALVYLSDGFNSPYFLALFLSVITNAVRFGAAASSSPPWRSPSPIVRRRLVHAGTISTDPNARVSALGIVSLFPRIAMATGY